MATQAFSRCGNCDQSYDLFFAKVKVAGKDSVPFACPSCHMDWQPYRAQFEERMSKGPFVAIEVRRGRGRADGRPLPEIPGHEFDEE